MKHINFTDYLKRPGISNSQLKHLSYCPKIFKYFVIDQNEKSDTDSMKLGRAFHTLILETHLFDQEYCVSPKIRRSGEPWKQLQAEAKEKHILWEEEYEKLTEMAQSIYSHPYASKFLEKTENETSIFWDTSLGDKTVKCKGRIDAIKTVGNKISLVDIKTTVDASPSGFTRQMFNLKYYMQAAYYMEGYEKITGIKPELFVFISVETKPPYLCGVYLLHSDGDTIKKGHQEYLSLLEKYIQCEEKGNWEEGYDEPINILLPPWYH